jgi:hypothetical protein
MNDKEWYRSLAGQELKNGYVLIEFIGEGKIGFVYRGSKKSMPDFEVAIKLTPGSPRDGWQNEIDKPQKLRRITGVVTFHEIDTHHITFQGHTEVFLYTVWDYIPPGRNLKQYLKQIDTCPTSFLVAILERILRVLHACEHRGVKRHGDLHAGNILIGDKDPADLDSSLNAREPIYISDFGYGTTGGEKTPKDDYQGLAQITNAIIAKTEWDKATPTDRQIIIEIKKLIQKVLRESLTTERLPPLDILKSVLDIDRRVRSSGGFQGTSGLLAETMSQQEIVSNTSMSVGQYQVSEMLGDNWERWRSLFVSSVPAKSRILEADAHTVITGPRGCGKTMLLRRLSERLIVECGNPDGNVDTSNFTAFYINANDIADAFSYTQTNSNSENNERLICYANLSILTDILAVQAARFAKNGDEPTTKLLESLKNWLIDESTEPLVTGQNELEYYRALLERIKWEFPKVKEGPFFAGYQDFSQHAWLPKLISMMRTACTWINSKTVFIFIDDYTTPRIPINMQRVLNRLFFQRSPDFVCKIATESATTFFPIDSSNKVLQDGDDFQLIDMGEEALFMQDSERETFLNEVFKRRLVLDNRIPENSRDLERLLGHLGLRKLEFARQLRQASEKDDSLSNNIVSAKSQRRGATKPKSLYFGCEVFTNLWSGDTRTMVQLIQELVTAATPSGLLTIVPIDSEIQNQVLRNRGGQWLDAQSRNEPTDPKELKRLLRLNQTFKLTGGSYGNHLKAVVEAFVKVARQLLLSPMYKIHEGSKTREVPRMAFRLEIVDELRLEGLEKEIYRDLIRYGMFMRDNRGKSVRGAFVPRLYLRRLLLPFATLALSKRDSVQLSCKAFSELLLTPDKFADDFSRYTKNSLSNSQNQNELFPEEREEIQFNELIEDRYNDIEFEESIKE